MLPVYPASAEGTQHRQGGAGKAPQSLNSAILLALSGVNVPLAGYMRNPKQWRPFGARGWGFETAHLSAVEVSLKLIEEFCQLQDL